jgi:hypothetical protein
MKTELKFSIELTADQLKELLRNFIEREYGIKDADVILTASIEYDQLDRGPGSPVCTGAKISAVLEPQRVSNFPKFPPGVRP